MKNKGPGVSHSLQINYSKKVCPRDITSKHKIILQYNLSCVFWEYEVHLGEALTLHWKTKMLGPVCALWHCNLLSASFHQEPLR